MAARVRLTADVDPEVKKQVRIAAIQSESTVSDWVERAVVRALEQEARLAVEETDLIQPTLGVKLNVPSNPIKLRRGKSISDTVLEDRGDW